MKHVITTLTTLALVLLTHAALAATSPVGSTPGSFAVSPSGAATYSIPIQVPPGVNGMQPNISLVYNSQAGNGIAGVGWNIGGLSEITRCGATIDRDGFKGGVNLDADDKFCLDGQRLIDLNITSASCTNGREYRTEIDSFSKVIGCGTQGNGPAYFTVTSKNGMTTEYGNGNGSQQYAKNNGTVLNWHVSKIKDVVGNYEQFIYNTDSATSGEHRIDHIDYTYLGTAFVGGVARSVKFNYSARSDFETSYVGGGAVNTSQRLTSVQTLLGGVPVRSYNFVYDNSAATGRSRLASVQECAWDAAWACYQPMVFDWHTRNEEFVQAMDYTAIPNMYFSYDGIDLGTRLADVNGDGKLDLVQLFLPSTSLYGGVEQRRVFLNTGASFVKSDSYTNSLPNAYFSYDGKDLGTRLEDIDGDGRPDLVQLFLPSTSLYGGVEQRRVYLNTGTSFVISNSYTTSLPNVYFSYDGIDLGTRLADVNGDGKLDLVQLFLPSTS